MFNKSSFVRDSTGLVKEFSATDALAMAMSNIGLTYVFDTCTFYVAAYPQANIMITTVIGLLLALPMVGLFSLFTIAMPRTGGDYVWVSRTLSPSLGFICSFVTTVMWLSMIGTVFPVSINWGAAAWIYQLGLLYGSPSYIGLAKYLTGPEPAFWLSIVQTIIAGIIVLGSTRLTRGIVRYWTYWGVIIGVVFIVMILTVGQSTFISNFNALSGANYYQVIKDGQAVGAYAGIPPIFSGSTLLGGAIRMLAIVGFNASVYFSGELKNVRKSQYLGQIGALVIFVAFETLIVIVMYLGMGPSFANAMAMLWYVGSSNFPWVTLPQAAGLSIFWVPNPFLSSLYSLT
jgi:amino acid transporter